MTTNIFTDLVDRAVLAMLRLLRRLAAARLNRSAATLGLERKSADEWAEVLAGIGVTVRRHGPTSAGMAEALSKFGHSAGALLQLYHAKGEFARTFEGQWNCEVCGSTSTVPACRACGSNTMRQTRQADGFRFNPLPAFDPVREYRAGDRRRVGGRVYSHRYTLPRDPP